MLRVVLRWLIGAAIVTWAVVVVVAQLARHATPWWLGVLPWIVIVVLVVLHASQSALRPGAGRSVRRTLGPGAQGLDEVQGIELGRPPGLVVTYGEDEPTTAELVVPRSDPLQEGPWTVAREPDGTVVVESGRDTAHADRHRPGASPAGRDAAPPDA